MQSQIDSICLLDFDITLLTAEQLVENCLNSESKNRTINTINPHSYVQQKTNKSFRKALKESHFLIPDGSGILFAARLIENKKIKKLAGHDFFIQTMKSLNKKKGKVFLLGSSADTLEKILKKAKSDYPFVQLVAHSPPFKKSFDKNDINTFIEKINLSKPDVIFVGLTAPKQEILINQMLSHINVKFISGIGAVFDFYSGKVKRPSKIWLMLHLEWFVRFLKQPKHLWRRVIFSMPIFILDCFIFYIKKFKGK